MTTCPENRGNSWVWEEVPKDRLKDFDKKSDDLPYVPPLKSSFSCRICRRWLEGEWSSATTKEARDEIQRQMGVGRCDDCTRRVAKEEG